MGKSIKISISPIGEAKVEAFGYVGGACKRDTAAIISALGDGSEETEDKPELYQVESEMETEAY